jgi:hypothetical protein
MDTRRLFCCQWTLIRSAKEICKRVSNTLVLEHSIQGGHEFQMRCQKCGGETAENELICGVCNTAENEIRVLSPNERDHFKGMTIQQGEEASADSGRGGADYEYSSEGPGHKVYVRQVSFGSSSMGLFAKLALVLFFLFFVFVALPLALIAMAIAVIWWMIRRR